MLYLSSETIECIQTPPRVRTFDWLCDYFADHHGRPFNPIDYPWCEGICDVWDLPQIRTVWLQFAARLGKSMLGFGLLTSSIAADPSNAMIGNATEELLMDTVRDKVWPTFMRCPITRPWCPSRHRQGQKRVDLTMSTIYGAWSGSTTRLADKDPRYKLAGEVDKWTKDASAEADPLELFLERGMEDPDRKSVIECTPSVAHHSRINRGLRLGSNCRFKVPCPKCGKHTQLVRGGIDKKTGEFDPHRGGLVWDHTEGGKSTAELARRTTRYHCPHCHKEWDDDQRKAVISKGKWVPLGCSIDRGGRIRGAGRNYPGPDASFQLGRLYAPSFSFGDNAAHWIQSQDSIEAIRNHVNSWDGEVWYPVRIDEEWEVVAARLCQLDYEARLVPVEASFLAMGIDVQIDHFVFHIIAWGAEGRGWVIDYGIAHTWADVRELQQTEYRHEDGGKPLHIAVTLLDARDGNRTDDIRDHAIEWNEEGRYVFASMGQDSTKMSGKAYTRMKSDAKRRSTRKGLDEDENPTFLINTNLWEQWVDNCLWHRTPGEARSLAYPREAVDDQDLFEQLLNVAPDFSVNDGGDTLCKYMMVDRQIGKDLRDSARYARVAAEVYTRGNWSRVPTERRQVPTRAVAVAAPTSPFVRKRTASSSSDGKRFVRRWKR